METGVPPAQAASGGEGQLGDLESGPPEPMKVTQGEPLSSESARIQQKLAAQVCGRWFQNSPLSRDARVILFYFIYGAYRVDTTPQGCACAWCETDIVGNECTAYCELDIVWIGNQAELYVHDVGSRVDGV